jgi:8-oxo-dGTP pyrophosphatase MutT (NUDIX family)
LKRTPERGDFWQTVTGGIHIGESLLQAAYRELREETSLTEATLSLFWTNIKYSFMGNDGYLLDEYVFEAKVQDASGFKMSTEHNAFDWLSPADAATRVRFENNSAAIQNLHTS